MQPKLVRTKGSHLHNLGERAFPFEMVEATLYTPEGVLKYCYHSILRCNEPEMLSARPWPIDSASTEPGSKREIGELELFTTQMVHVWHHEPHECLFGRPAKGDSRSLKLDTTKSEAARALGMSHHSVKRYAEDTHRSRSPASVKDSHTSLDSL